MAKKFGKVGKDVFEVSPTGERRHIELPEFKQLGLNIEHLQELQPQQATTTPIDVKAGAQRMFPTTTPAAPISPKVPEVIAPPTTSTQLGKTWTRKGEDVFEVVGGQLGQKLSHQTFRTQYQPQGLNLDIIPQWWESKSAKPEARPSMTVESLDQQTEIDISSQTAEAEVDIIGTTTVAGAQKDVDIYNADKTKREEELEEEVSGITTAMKDLLEEADEGKEAATLKAEEKEEVRKKQEATDDAYIELETKLAEIKALEAQEAQEVTKLEGQSMSRTHYLGDLAQLRRTFLAEKRALESEAGMLQAKALGLQGKLDRAKAAVDKAVELKYADIQQRFNNQLALYKIVKGELTEEQDKRLATLEQFTQQQNDILQEQKDVEKEEKSVLLRQLQQYPDAGITLQDSLETANQKIATQSRIYQEEVRPPQYATEPDKFFKTSPEGEQVALSPLAQSVWNGVLNIKDLTPTAKAQVAPELDRAGWTQIVTNEQKADFDAVNRGVEIALNAWENIPSYWRGKFQGRITSLFRLEEDIPEISNFRAKTDIVGMQLTRLFEKGRISDEDRKFYLARMPNLNMNLKSAKAAVDGLKEILNSKLQSNIAEVNQFISSGVKDAGNNDPLNIR